MRRCRRSITKIGVLIFRVVFYYSYRGRKMDFTTKDLNKTKWVKPEWLEKNRSWIEIDAQDIILWKLAEKVARFLIGKGKAYYADAWDTGDFVVVQNVDKIKFTGNKLLQKKYYRYSGWKGNVKEKTLGEMLNRHPERVLWYAVRGMLPKNKLRARRMKRLKLFTEPNNKFNYCKPLKVAA